MNKLVMLGLANWIVTTILVEGEIFRPLRDACERTKWLCRLKLDYLVHCHLCAGTWVGIALAGASGWRPLGSGVVGLVLAGVIIKGAGHFILDVTARLGRV